MVTRTWKEFPTERVTVREVALVKEHNKFTYPCREEDEGLNIPTEISFWPLVFCRCFLLTEAN